MFRYFLNFEYKNTAFFEMSERTQINYIASFHIRPGFLIYL
jgi:hypothetical protein